MLKSSHHRCHTLTGASAKAILSIISSMSSSLQASAEVRKASSQSKGGVTPDRWLFEPVHGLPIVRKELK